MGVDKGIRSFPIIGSTVERKVADLILSIINEGKSQKLVRDSIASVQVTPNSEFLEGANGINRTKIEGLEFYAIYGDVHASVRQMVFGKSIEKKIDFGDGLILADSASYSDWTYNTKKYAFDDRMFLDVKFNRSGSVLAAELQISNLGQIKTLHTSLLSNADSKNKVICILKSDKTDGC